MKGQGHVRRPWLSAVPFLLTMGALFVGVFVWADSKIFPNASIVTSTSATQMSGSSPASDPVPSDAVIAKLTNAVANVTGLNDMAVLPDGTGDGKYVVSAIVDVTESGTGVTSSTVVQQDVDALVNNYFQDVYSVSAPVSQAELTVTEDGQIVASAGLGNVAYQSLATTTMQGDLAAELLSGPVRNDNSSDEMWFEMKS